MNSRMQRKGMIVAALAAVVGMFTVPAWANIYPSSLTITDTDVSGTCELLKVSYVLNESANGDGVNPGVKFEVLDGSNAVVRTVTLARQAKGKYTFEWDGRDDSGATVANGNYSVKITATDYGHCSWTQISDNANMLTHFERPRGVAVNRNPNSPYYGRTYVSNPRTNATASGRPMGDGIYVLNADQSDAVGQGNTALTGGLNFSGDPSVAPWKLKVGPDDNLYIGDWSNTTAQLSRTDPNVGAGTGVQVLNGVGDTVAPTVHGSIASAPVITGTLAGGDLKVYALDEDLSPFQTAWFWNVGAGPLPYNTPPVLLADLLISSVKGVNVDMDRGPDGKFYIEQNRSNGTETGLFVTDSTGANVLFDSLLATRALTGDNTSVDLLRQSRSVAVYPDGSKIAILTDQGNFRILSLTSGVPSQTNLAQMITIIAHATGAASAQIVVDQVGNVYTTNNITERLKVHSPPDGVNSSNTTSGTAGLNKSGSGGPTITDQPDDAQKCPTESATFTVVDTGTSPTYAWKKNAVALVNGGNIAGADTNSLTVSNLTSADDGGVYTVEVCDANGVALSNPAILTVGVSFAKPPCSQTICAGQNATFDVVVRSVGTPSYQWKKTLGMTTTNVGTNSPTLTLTAVPASDSGSLITVEVTDTCGTATSPAATLTVRTGPVLTSASGNKSTAAGGSATYSISAIGIGTVHYQWKVNGSNEGTDSPFLTITNIPCSFSGASITVDVTDDCGTTTATVGTLTVTPVQEVCNNGIDDDCDGGLVDCADADCNNDPNCAPVCNQPFADTDADGDADLHDFAEFQACYTGPSATVTQACRCFDRNGDTHVDDLDFQKFMDCATQSTVNALASCDDYPTGAVVINEVSYDMLTETAGDATDNLEFVELYNSGASAVDISGWVVRASDTQAPGTDNNRDYIVPGFPGSGTTTLASHDYWVIGNSAVAGVDQIPNPAIDLWENDNEAIQLLDGNYNVVDTVIYERNKGAVAVSPAEGAIWGNTSRIASSLPGTLPQSLSRWKDGVDTNVNGRDFGLRPETPGTSNLSTYTEVASYVPPDVNTMSPLDPVPGLTGSFVGGLVINPADDTTLLGATNKLNPNVIVASPQGGNAIIAWDPAGGGDMVASNDIMTGNGGYDLWVYFDTTDITISGAESSSYGIMGTTDTAYNFPDPTGNFFPNSSIGANGDTGVAWVFQKDNANNHKRLVLVDAKDGGDSFLCDGTPSCGGTSIYWTVVQTIDMSSVASGWYRLRISYTSATGAVAATFDTTTYNFNTAAGITGGFYVGYRESLAGQPVSLRPPTFDLRP